MFKSVAAKLAHSCKVPIQEAVAAEKDLRHTCVLALHKPPYLTPTPVFSLQATTVKSVTAKLAHNSTIPALALAGNPRLQPLQEAITAEKLLLQECVHGPAKAALILTPVCSLQTLSTTFDKSSEALRAWAGGEGEDLKVCSTVLLSSTARPLIRAS